MRSLDYQKAVIVAGDSDLVPLVEALVDFGRFVEVRCGQLNTSGELFKVCFLESADPPSNKDRVE